MGLVIWKYELEMTGRQMVTMPENARPLAVQVQGSVPVMWALVDSSRRSEDREFVMYGTGQRLPDAPGTYLGTFQNGPFVFHLFDPDHA